VPLHASAESDSEFCPILINITRKRNEVLSIDEDDSEDEDDIMGIAGSQLESSRRILLENPNSGVG